MSSKILILALLLPLGALAQEAAPPLPQDPRAPRFREVERGFSTGFEVGYLTLFKTPTADPGRYSYAGQGGGRSSGVVVGMTAGYDVTDWLAVSLFALGANSEASASYGGFSVFAGGGDLRLALFGARDAYRVERLFVYVHGRAGYMLSYPMGLFASHDVYLAGGPGVEYFTHLRHFSIGLAADVVYVAKAGAAGLAVTPTVRYTF